jgi:hypothetical protein|tara:strand:+ start:2481 stop:3116 length:636 start_codon:yes stop_codon:yes gene_type:complete
MAAIKTYAVLENDITSNRNDAYSYFVFKSLRELKGCKELNEHSIVFSEVQQLQDTYSEEELRSVVAATQGECSLPNYPSFHKNFAEFVHERAKKYKPVSKEKQMTAEVVNLEADGTPPLAEQAIDALPKDKPKRVAKSKYNTNAKILVIAGASGVYQNPYREGSNRWHNFEALVKSDTVGEALAAMKALSPGGNSVDIRLAIEKGAIKLGE